MTRMSPAWWKTAIDESHHTPERASGFEALLVTEINRVRESANNASDNSWASQPWAVAMQSGDINAWLEFTAPKWVKNQSNAAWPIGLETVRVCFQNDGLLIGVRIRSGDRFQFLSARLTPRIEPDGALWFTTSDISVGCLQLPAPWVLRRAPKILEYFIPASVRDSPQAARLLAVLEGTVPATSEPSIQLADGRHVRILELHTKENRLEIVVRTERR